MASSSGDPTGIVAFVFLWIGSACIGYAIGYSKGKETEGFLLGLLGPIGWVIAAVIQGTSEAEAARHAAVEQHRAEHPAAQRQQAAPDPTAQYEQLERVHQLHQSGVLTDEEYAAEKRELLGTPEPGSPGSTAAGATEFA